MIAIQLCLLLKGRDDITVDHLYLVNSSVVFPNGPLSRLMLELSTDTQTLAPQEWLKYCFAMKYTLLWDPKTVDKLFDAMKAFNATYDLNRIDCPISCIYSHSPLIPEFYSHIMLELSPMVRLFPIDSNFHWMHLADCPALIQHLL